MILFLVFLYFMGWLDEWLPRELRWFDDIEEDEDEMR